MLFARKLKVAVSKLLGRKYRRTKLALLASLVLFLLYWNQDEIFCALFPGDSWDESEFGPPITLNDGITGVFTYSRSVYRLEGGGIMPFSGAKPNYFIDVKLIGTVNGETGEVKILQRKKHDHYGDGKGRFYLHASVGDTVLVWEEPTKQYSFQSSGRYFLLNVKTNQKTEIPLEEEFAANGHRFHYRYLVKTDGTMVFTAGNPGGPGDVWIRSSNGEYSHLGSDLRFSGFKDDNAFLVQYVPERASICKAFNISDQSQRIVPCQDWRGIRGEGNISHILWPDEQNKKMIVTHYDNGVQVREPLKIPRKFLK